MLQEGFVEDEHVGTYLDITVFTVFRSYYALSSSTVFDTVHLYAHRQINDNEFTSMG